MKNKAFFGLVLFIFIFSLSILSCSSGSNSNVKIRINLGQQNENALNTHENSIFDSFLRLFTKDAKALAPSGITSFSLAVTGEGMDAINNTYGPETTAITLDVPSGSGRIFQLTAYRPTGNYGGSATQDLTAGATADITINMAMQYASVTINPSFPAGTPVNLISYTVNVTTAGDSVLSASATYGNPIPVPAGDAKDFEVFINTPSATFRGTAMNQTLAAEAAVSVAVNNMTLYETKIVIPDYYNNRIVQIDDMGDAGWTVVDGTTLTDPAALDVIYPYDIDFDSQGRIYFANDVNIIRIDDITSASYTTIYSDVYTFTAIAVDRINNYAYYATSIAWPASLFKQNLQTAATEQLVVDSNANNNYIIGAIQGMDIDQNGILYIAGVAGSEASTIFKYNPGTQTVDAIYNTGLVDPWDVLVKSPYLYVAHYDSFGVEDKIIQFNLDFTSPAYLYQKDAANYFYGPHRFVAILNKKIYITDDDGGYGSQLVAIDNINGDNWTTYGTHGTGSPGYFKFWANC